MSIISGSFGYKSEKCTISFLTNSAVIRVPCFEKVYKGANREPSWNNFTIEIWFGESSLDKAMPMFEAVEKANTVCVTGSLEIQQWEKDGATYTKNVIKPLEYWKIDFYNKKLPETPTKKSSQSTAPPSLPEDSVEAPF